MEGTLTIKYGNSKSYRVELINSEIMPYIEQSDREEQIAYMEELNKVKNNWCKLIHSGIYHDAIGKVVDAQFSASLIVVKVETEY